MRATLLLSLWALSVSASLLSRQSAQDRNNGGSFRSSMSQSDQNIANFFSDNGQDRSGGRPQSQQMSVGYNPNQGLLQQGNYQTTGDTFRGNQQKGTIGSATYNPFDNPQQTTFGGNQQKGTIGSATYNPFDNPQQTTFGGNQQKGTIGSATYNPFDSPQQTTFGGNQQKGTIGSATYNPMQGKASQGSVGYNQNSPGFGFQGNEQAILKGQVQMSPEEYQRKKAELDRQIADAINNIFTICAPSTGNFQEYTVGGQTKEVPNFNAYKLFQNGQANFLGQGSFGKVIWAMWVDKTTKVAIKQTMITEENRFMLPGFNQELIINREITAKAPSIGPRFYGCQYVKSPSGDLQEFYFVNEMLMGSWFNDAANLKAMPRSQFLYLNIRIMEKLQLLWDLGYRHGDIKLANIMVNADRTDAYLVDFGLAQKTRGQCVYAGTPGYLSPGMWDNRPRCLQKDDIYSWLVAFLGAQIEGGEVAMFADYERFPSVIASQRDPKPKSCIMQQQDKKCMEDIKNYFMKKLVELGWGDAVSYDETATRVTITQIARDILTTDRYMKDYYYDDIRETLILQQYLLRNEKIHFPRKRGPVLENYSLEDLEWFAKNRKETPGLKEAMAKVKKLSADEKMSLEEYVIKHKNNPNWI